MIRTGGVVCVFRERLRELWCSVFGSFLFSIDMSNRSASTRSNLVSGGCGGRGGCIRRKEGDR